VTLWLAQSDEDARRLVAMGALAESVRAIGNLKYDVRAPKHSRVAELIKEAAAGRPIVVAGSTVDRLGHSELGENDMLLHAWHGQMQNNGAVLVLAPRHPESFGYVYSVAMEYPTLRASEMLEGKRECETRPVEIVVLDTIGDLAAVYGVADVAFVGGSLVKRGGHNPLEPAQFGVPVVMGPSFENFRGIVEAMREANGIAILGQNTGVSPLRPSASGRDDACVVVEELEETIVRLLTDHEAAKAMGERGRRVFEEQQGATARAVEAIVAMVKP
jgi:3-deoxy-D-manno-octulosonic-acid transferase